MLGVEIANVLLTMRGGEKRKAIRVLLRNLIDHAPENKMVEGKHSIPI
jgi:hypothetical protein